MSNNGVLLDTSQPPELAYAIDTALDLWQSGEWQARHGTLRSRWLTAVEHTLAYYYPQASSADRKLTARSLAPFALVRPNTP